MMIQIDPLDTLFFRDGKPFNMGDETWAYTGFPPYPSVIYGALRSAYFSNHIDELGKAKEADDPTKALKIRGIYFLAGQEIYLHLPADCVKEKDNIGNLTQVAVLLMTKNKNTNNSLTDCILSYKNDIKVENVSNGLVRKSMFKKYLIQNAIEKFYIKKISDYVLPEPKIGIGIDKKTGTSEEGKLYRADMRRLSNEENDKVSIIVDFEGLNLPEEGLMKLGGEGKAASYKKYNEEVLIDFPVAVGTMFKLYLSTPAIFEKGWIPEWIDEDTLIGNYKEIEAKLLTTAIGKPIHIGGFDMKNRKPKPMYKAVPAGSVYYFGLQKGTMEDVKKAFYQTAISDIYPEQGFGITYVGKISKGGEVL